MPGYEVTSINLEVFGLTRPGFEPVGSGPEPVIFKFPNLPKRDVGVWLLIRPPQPAFTDRGLPIRCPDIRLSYGITVPLETRLLEVCPHIPLSHIIPIWH